MAAASWITSLNTREGVNPKGVPRIVKEFGAVLVVDCDNNGPSGDEFRHDACIERAAIHGMRSRRSGSNHAGTMEYYA